MRILALALSLLIATSLTTAGEAQYYGYPGYGYPGYGYPGYGYGYGYPGYGYPGYGSRLRLSLLLRPICRLLFRLGRRLAWWWLARRQLASLSRASHQHAW
jgi:hypothetical protein